MNKESECSDCAARQEIDELLVQYCRSMDRRDDELGYAVFHFDAQVDYGDLFVGSGYDFIRWAHAYHDTLLSHHHEIGRTLLKIHGDSAVAETYVTVSAIEGQADRKLLRTAVGRYLDRIEKRDGKWGIARRQYVRNFRWDQEVVNAVVAGVHTAEDPSYLLFASMKDEAKEN